MCTNEMRRYVTYAYMHQLCKQKNCFVLLRFKTNRYLVHTFFTNITKSLIDMKSLHRKTQTQSTQNIFHSLFSIYLWLNTQKFQKIQIFFSFLSKGETRERLWMANTRNKLIVKNLAQNTLSLFFLSLLSLSLYICLSQSIFFSLFSLSVCITLCLSPSLFASLFLCLSLSLFVSLSVCLFSFSLCPSACLSLSPLFSFSLSDHFIQPP